MSDGIIPYSQLLEFAGAIGVHDVACPICGPERRSAVNRRRKVLRIWRTTSDFATYRCARCDASGFARADGARALDRSALAKARAAALQYARTAAEDKRRRARWLWRRRLPIAGTLAERYLREVRSYGGHLPPTIGFLPARDNYSAAMIAAFGPVAEAKPGLMSIEPEAVQAVHLTRLAADGSKAGTHADKIMIGVPLGAPITLAMPGDLGGLAIAEGIEDALSVHEATGLGAWAAGSASLMPALAGVITNCIESVTIMVDDDDAGRRNSDELACLLEERGIEVRSVSCWSAPA